MPTLPLYTVNPPHPLASRHVLAPGGYERWWFDAESEDGSLRVIATFSRGFVDHPDYGTYLRRYKRFLAGPTRRPPPLAAEYPWLSVGVYENGRRLCEDAGVWRGDTDSFAAQPDGSVLLRLARQRLQAELLFRPTGTAESRDVALLERASGALDSPWSGEHRWAATGLSCEVEGKLNDRPIRGLGYHDHRFGTAPVAYAAGFWFRGRVLREGHALAFCVAHRVDRELVRGVESTEAGVRHVEGARGFRRPASDVIHLEPLGLKLSRPEALRSSQPCVWEVYETRRGDADGLALCESVVALFK